MNGAPQTVTMYVTYPGDASAPFDRDYWIHSHLPLVMECWGPYGLLSAVGFFPSVDGGGLVAICSCVFRDEAAMQAALAAPESARVMDDVPKFTTLQPAKSRAVPL